MGDAGYVKGFRSCRDTVVWTDSYYRYYMDLKMEACYENRTYRFGSNVIGLQRGQYVTTYRRLARRWDKSISWVHRFLKRLEKAGLVRLERLPRSVACGTPVGTSAGTIITMLNYDSDEQLRDCASMEKNSPRNAKGDIEVRRNNKKRPTPEDVKGADGTLGLSAVQMSPNGIQSPRRAQGKKGRSSEEHIVGEEYQECMKKFGRRPPEGEDRN